MNILIYSLQRSGSNYLKELLKKNFKVKVMNDLHNRDSILHKHFRFYDNKSIIPERKFYNTLKIDSYNDFINNINFKIDYIFVISKDPYSWYLSYKKWSIKCGWPIPNHDYIEEYNLFYSKLLHLSEESDKFVFIRYIDLLECPNNILNYIYFNLNFKKSLNLKITQYLNSNNYITNIKKVRQSNNFDNQKSNYYKKKKYLEYLSESEFTRINNLVDNHVTIKLGYNKFNTRV